MSSTTGVPAGRALVAEGLGSAFLLATVVGSGIMAERLAAGAPALALLANTFATGAGLVALILAFGGISGAHFNPAVSLSAAWLGRLSWKSVAPYLAVQVAGAIAGVAMAHLMFDLPIAQLSSHVRAGRAQALSEAVATFGLVIVIWGCSSFHPRATPVAVGAYIVAAYWFTASTSFANPAVTVARCFTETFSGIRPQDAIPFVVAQIVGAAVGTWLSRWLFASANDPLSHR